MILIQLFITLPSPIFIFSIIFLILSFVGLSSLHYPHFILKAPTVLRSTFILFFLRSFASYTKPLISFYTATLRISGKEENYHGIFSYFNHSFQMLSRSIHWNLNHVVPGMGGISGGSSIQRDCDWCSLLPPSIRVDPTNSHSYGLSILHSSVSLLLTSSFLARTMVLSS